MKKFLMGVVFTISLILGLTWVISFAKKDLTKVVVSITNYQKTSGGSGFVLYSDDTESVILTNAHVCEVVECGGLITTADNKDHFVHGFKKSQEHDICGIYIKENLNLNVDIADKAPKMFDKIKIIGHPALYPTIITEGHISDHKIVTLAVGQRPCSEKERTEPDTAIRCLFTGVMPILKNYDSVVTSATIMPGSSGSGVFNEQDQLVGLAFAGMGDLGYAITVPYEYVKYFIQHELITLDLIKVK